MLKQKLSAVYSFGIESYKERLRLVVFKNDVEFVCRKENLKNLAAFLSGESGHIFKGRLQLIKKTSIISIQVKGETISEISTTGFQILLSGFLEEAS